MLHPVQRQPDRHNRLDAVIRRGERLLVGYFPVGDPLVPVHLLDVYRTGGVDVVEIGIKAADPFMDGPIVAASMSRSTGHGMLGDASAALERLRSVGLATLVFAYDTREFATGLGHADWCGVDGLLGLPRPDAGRGAAIRASAVASRVRIAEFVPYAFGEADIERARQTDAYVMLQAADGKTGPRPMLDRGCEADVRRLRAEGVTAPIVLGFGVSSATHARQAVELGADGVVVGSECVTKCLAGEAALEDFLGALRDALNG